jgi:hypothetical protein
MRDASCIFHDMNTENLLHIPNMVTRKVIQTYAARRGLIFLMSF